MKNNLTDLNRFKLDNPGHIFRISKLRMLKHLRGTYSHFDAVLDFVKKNKLPTCKCAIAAETRGGHDAVEWGYSSAAEHVAAAICMAFSEMFGSPDDENEVEDMSTLRVRWGKARAEGRVACVLHVDFPFMWVEPLSAAKVEGAKQDWISREMRYGEGKKIPPKRLKALLSKHDPWKELLIHPFLPGGEWLPY